MVRTLISPIATYFKKNIVFENLSPIWVDIDMVVRLFWLALLLVDCINYRDLIP